MFLRFVLNHLRLQNMLPIGTQQLRIRSPCLYYTAFLALDQVTIMSQKNHPEGWLYNNMFFVINLLENLDKQYDHVLKDLIL